MRPPPNKLPFPLTLGIAKGAWNWLFFTSGVFKPDPAKSAEWNRGAYLVEGLGHCGACHTPTNLMGAAKTRQAYQGGVLDNWFAPNLTDNSRNGLGDWTEDDIVSFLKTGRTAKAVAYGPMAQVVQDSTSHLTDADLKAVAVYLKAVTGPKPSEAFGPAGECGRCRTGDLSSTGARPATRAVARACPRCSPRLPAAGSSSRATRRR